MIPWVDEQCRAWGAHKRWILHGVDGWPERSILGRLIDEGPGAGHVAPHSTCPIKDPPPAYSLVSVSLQLMSETHVMGKEVEVLTAHYLLPGYAKQKAPWLDVSLKEYWNRLHSGHAFIVGVEAKRNLDMRVDGEKVA